MQIIHVRLKVVAIMIMSPPLDSAHWSCDKLCGGRRQRATMEATIVITIEYPLLAPFFFPFFFFFFFFSSPHSTAREDAKVQPQLTGHLQRVTACFAATGGCFCMDVMDKRDIYAIVHTHAYAYTYTFTYTLNCTAEQVSSGTGIGLDGRRD